MSGQPSGHFCEHWILHLPHDTIYMTYYEGINMADFKDGKAILAGLIVCGAVLGVVAGKMNHKGAETAAPVVSSEAAPEDNGQTAESQTIALVSERGTGITVTKSSDWAEQFPNQYETYMMNSENDEIVDYIEQNPYIKTLYNGYGFAIEYGSARGHTYVVDDVTSTGRPHKLANCFTCKTSDMTALALNEGDAAYAMNFEDVETMITDPFGCFHCHQNEPGVLYVTHTYLADALGEDINKVDPANLSCGQCHSEYYFKTDETHATTFAYNGLDTMNPDDILAYYNNMKDEDGNAYADWVQEDTGIRMLKVQHPEFETFLGAGSPHASNMTCADCHMGTVTAEDGTTFTNHNWISPLDSQEMLDNTCSKCHGDLAAEVAAIQKETTDRENEIGYALEEMNHNLAAAVSEGTRSEEDLNAIREAARTAQFYWDFVYVENSEGVHNPTLTKECLDKAQQYLDEANSLLAK